MADTIDASKIAQNHSVGVPGPINVTLERSRLWDRVALGAIMLLSIFMNFYKLGQNGFGNAYYAAGVRSMADSLHNFFFVSYDPGGFVTIDKPAVGFWLQTISTRIFGFTPFSIFFPQALSGVLAVLLLYFLVRRHFGIVAGLVAALALAVSPISVVTNRNNTIDSTLALVLLLAAWAIIRAAENGKLRWLLLSAVFVGVGFNVKMSEAYLVLPTLLMTYLLCAPRKLWTRIWHLALFFVVMLAISLSWVVAVDLIPADQRPYVGSTQVNSEVSLAFGYNGLNRLHIGNIHSSTRATRNTTNSGQTGVTRSPAAGTKSTNTNEANRTTGGPGNQGNPQRFPGGGGFPGAGGGGMPAIFALFGVTTGGQIAWLLPFALLGIIALAWQRRFNFQRDHQQLGLILWGFWLLTMTVFFTLNGSFHQYYMTEMAPGLSAMVGIGLVIMLRDYRAAGWRGWLLPFALAITAAAQIYMLKSFPLWASWMSPIIGVVTGIVVLILLVLRIRPQIAMNGLMKQAASIALAFSVLALLIAPTVWAGYSVIYNTESSAPTAGPSALTSRPVRNVAAQATNNTRGGQNAFAGGGFGGEQTSTGLINYLVAHQGTTKFLVATPNSMSASSIILAVNKPVMALGGFSGIDPILTVSDLQTLINNNTIRYFLFPASRSTQGRVAGNASGTGALIAWVAKSCSIVPTSDLQTSNKPVNLGSNQLYVCTPAS